MRPYLLILTSLAGGAKHGYALTKDIESFAGVTLGPGTLYGALVRLEEQDLIRPMATQDRRQPYELTAAGAALLRARLVDMGEIARIGLGRLAPS